MTRLPPSAVRSCRLRGATPPALVSAIAACRSRHVELLNITVCFARTSPSSARRREARSRASAVGLSLFSRVRNSVAHFGRLRRQRRRRPPWGTCGIRGRSWRSGPRCNAPTLAGPSACFSGRPLSNRSTNRTLFLYWRRWRDLNASPRTKPLDTSSCSCRRSGNSLCRCINFAAQSFPSVSAQRKSPPSSRPAETKQHFCGRWRGRFTIRRIFCARSWRSTRRLVGNLLEPRGNRLSRRTR